MPEIQVNGVSYFYELTGEKRSLSLSKCILLHGFTGSSQNWQTLLPSLTPHFQILTLDILGHGRSASPPDPTRYHMAQVAADSALLLLDQQTDQPAHLLGYSMGGRLALYLAAALSTAVPLLDFGERLSWFEDRSRTGRTPSK